MMNEKKGSENMKNMKRMNDWSDLNDETKGNESESGLKYVYYTTLNTNQWIPYLLP